MCRFLVIALALVLLPAAQAEALTAYVVDSNGDQVTPIDLATGTPGTPIPVGTQPIAIAIAPDGAVAYVVSPNDESVTPIDLATGAPKAPIPVELPQRLAVDPTGGTAYVASSGIDAVTPIDLAAGTPGAPIPAGEYPVGIAIAPDGATAYVTNMEADTVTPIDLATGTPGTPIPVGTTPIAIAVTPDGASAYVANRFGDSVTPIDLATETPGAPIPVGANPYAIAITPDGAAAYVANEGSDDVTPIDLATGTPGAPIPVGGQPAGIAIAPDGEAAYISMVAADVVRPIALPDGTPGIPIPVGDGPTAIAVAPAQSPAAAFDAAPAAAGQATAFDASAAAAPGGAIVAYEWEFGDNASRTTTSPTVQHAYAAPGPYTATLTVRNECAPGAPFAGEVVFTGQTAYCHGAPTARTSRRLAIEACPRLVVSPRGYVPARKLRGRQLPGVRARIAVNSSAQLEVAARLRFKLGGHARTVALGRRTLGNAGARNLRLPLPPSLRESLPLGTRVTLQLRISATAACGPSVVVRKSIPTRVAKVLVSRNR